MHTDFHVNWLAKQYGLDQLAMMAGFKKATGSFVAASRIERDKKQERAVILSLIAEGYLASREPGEIEYEVTDKAFGRIKSQEWSGELQVGSDAQPLATHLSGGVIKGMLIDLDQGRAALQRVHPTHLDGPWNGGLVCIKTKAAITSDEQRAEQWVFDNLPALACELLDMSEASAQLVSLRGVCDGRPLQELSIMIGEAMESCEKEINRAKMRREALATMTNNICLVGGWEKFIAGCRSMQQLKALVDATGQGKAALEQAGKMFRGQVVIGAAFEAAKRGQR